MPEVKIECPHCHKSFQLTESLAAPFVELTRRRLSEQAKKATQQHEEEKAELESAIEVRDQRLAKSRRAEADFRRKERRLEDKVRALDVELEKRLAAGLRREQQKARKAADEEYRLKLAEERKRNQTLIAQLTDAKRRAEQGSQQNQGEVAELDLSRRLGEAFPRDSFEEVAKGRSGADVLHRVLTPSGQPCGAILWESKRTKNWSAGWTDKLKHDQRAARADVAVIVTEVMPAGIETFAELDGIWVTAPVLAIPLAAVLRAGLMETYGARRAADGQPDKMAILYQYMTGPDFRRRVTAIHEGFKALQDDLDSERRAMQNRWATREKQLELVMLATAGMYGDLQAIAGTALPQIQGLDLPSLPAPDGQSRSEP